MHVGDIKKKTANGMLKLSPQKMNVTPFVNPWSAHCFLKFLKKRRQFRCTGLLRSSKVVHLDGKNLPCFI